MTNIIPHSYATARHRAEDTVQNVNEQANLLTDMVAKIRSSSQEEQILNTAVQCIRSAIDCDRAVIYSLQARNRGKIVAESVVAAYPKTIGMTILDPCFEARYIDKYQMGRVRAISDIYQAGMTPCYIENLEKINVRASLVVPILSDPQTLYGLLVLHQCDIPRQWIQSEIDLTIQIAVQIGFILEHAVRLAQCQKLERKLEQVAQWQKILPQINRHIYGGKTRLEVLQITAAQTQKLLRCDRIVVYSLLGGSKGKIVAEVTKPALAPILGRTMIDPCFDYGYAAEYQNGRVRAIDNIHQAGLTPCYLESLATLGVKANLVAPILLANGRLIGLLVAHECFEFRRWKSSEIEWVRQIAMQCGLAVANARLQEKHVLMQSATQMLADARSQLHNAIEIGTQATTATTELESISSEIRSLIRLLEQETVNSSQNSPTDDKNILPIIAKRLQRNIDKWQTTLDRLIPQQQQVVQLLSEMLEARE